MSKQSNSYDPSTINCGCRTLFNDGECFQCLKIKANMKFFFKLISISLVGLFVSGLVILIFSNAPPLLTGLDFSKAVYDDQDHLLRLTLNKNDKYRLFTPLSAIPSTLISTTLLQEDQYFRWHYGINPLATLQAIWQTYVIHSRRQGSSTITMQVARMRFGIHSKTVAGKCWQIFRAIQLERHYSKEAILEAYLNLAPYGGNIEGVGAASLIYFNRPVQKINLPEALTLSIIPQNPNQRATNHQKLASLRNKLFIRWLEQHPEDADKKSMLTLPLVIRNHHALPFLAPHFVNAVLQNLPVESQIIHTTLNGSLQTLLEHLTHRYMERKQSLGAYNAAVLLVDSRDMGIKALVGSANFFNTVIGGQIDGTSIKRSPGSTLKPFIYALALDQGLIHPNTVLHDVPHSFGSYNPENFDYDFMGPVKAKEALTLSRNIPAIFLANQLKNPNLYEFLTDAHIDNLKSESFYGLALTLGGAELSMKELTSLYLMLLNEGLWRPIRSLKNEKPSAGERLLSPEASFLVLDMLKDTPLPEKSYTSLSQYRSTISWKTGTSSGFRDAWAIGTFGPYVLTVWIGNFDNKGNPAFIGKNIAAPLFFELIDAIKHETGNLPFLENSAIGLNLVKIDVCKASGMLPTRYCHDTEKTWFIPGKSPIKTDTIYREVAIDPRTGLRTCHFDETTHFEIYEFWPSDLLTLFKKAGIQRRSPPLFNPDCPSMAMLGIKPQITSPKTQLDYIMRANINLNPIPLMATTDGDVADLYWFINEVFLAKTRRNQAYIWHAKPGKFVIRVVDDHGQSDARDITVRLEN